MQNKTTLWTIVGLIVILLVGYFVYYQRQKSESEGATSFITTFEDCVSAGYPVMESYPRKCTSPEGNIYTEDVSSGDAGINTASAGEGCYIGGCSQQICSDEPGAMSTCEYKPEYSCYQSARCEKQQDGKCGWTETVALNQCLSVKLGDISK
jgi:hypothetical protein